MIRTLLLGAILSFALYSCKTSSNTSGKLDKINIEVAIADDACSFDTLKLFSWKGVSMKEISKTAFVNEENWKGFRFELDSQIPEGLYFVGNSFQDMKTIILGNESTIKLEGNCSAVSKLSTSSKVINGFENNLKVITDNNTNFIQLLQKYQANLQNPAQVELVTQELATLDTRKQNFLDSVKKAGDITSVRVASLNTYLSYQNNKSPGQTEGQYIAENFFKYVDLQDSAYSTLPYYFESIKNYSNNLTKAGLNAQQQQEYLDALAQNFTKEHPNHKPTMLGIAFGVMNANPQLFVKYTKAYLKEYEGLDANLDKFLKEQIKTIQGPLPIGEEAPQFSEKTPDGKDLALKDFRGKVVLIDFWASWCGPCRKENPNVVRLYNKYKDKGFDILGVSLDKNKERWLAAIEKDQLTWSHVSDLKGWNCAVAKQYGVRGIPFTVLVDKEGKILGTRLRGTALEQKLASIFGE
ncbi:MAG: TlpA family protein disulfide reductase [Saprospiraceae bacterium]|nr:TlpA family protein disulfide reductase [Saprospiraceae bacterium]